MFLIFSFLNVNTSLFLRALALILIITVLFGRKRFRTFIVPGSLDKKPFELLFSIRIPEIVRSLLGVKVNDYVDLKIIDKNVKPVKKKIRKLIVRKSPQEIIHTLYGIVDKSLLGMYLQDFDPSKTRRIKVEITPHWATYYLRVLRSFGSIFVTLISLLIALSEIIFGVLKFSFYDILSLTIIISSIYTILTVPFLTIKEPWGRIFKLKFLQMLIGRPKQYEEVFPDYEKSTRYVLITATHVEPPAAEYYIGALATIIARKTGARALIGRVSRAIVDLNRSESNWHPFRKRIRELIKKGEVKLIIDIHGMGNRDYDIEIGTGTDESRGLEPTASSQTVDLFRNSLAQAGFRIVVNEYFKGAKGGTIIRTFYRRKNETYLVEALQIEIADRVRRDPASLRKLIAALCSAIEKYCANINL